MVEIMIWKVECYAFRSGPRTVPPSAALGRPTTVLVAPPALADPGTPPGATVNVGAASVINGCFNRSRMLGRYIYTYTF
jgi:hypothetical protein